MVANPAQSLCEIQYVIAIAPFSTMLILSVSSFSPKSFHSWFLWGVFIPFSFDSGFKGASPFSLVSGQSDFFSSQSGFSASQSAFFSSQSCISKFTSFIIGFALTSMENNIVVSTSESASQSTLSIQNCNAVDNIRFASTLSWRCISLSSSDISILSDKNDLSLPFSPFSFFSNCSHVASPTASSITPAYGLSSAYRGSTRSSTLVLTEAPANNEITASAKIMLRDLFCRLFCSISLFILYHLNT